MLFSRTSGGVNVIEDLGYPRLGSHIDMVSKTAFVTCDHVFDASHELRFIFFFGMGPFRWNVMTCYMLLVSSKLCIEGASPHHPVTELTSASLTYIAFFGLIIPSIGCLDPETLGRYFGGYRSLAL